jgi:hypothetical protein
MTPTEQAEPIAATDMEARLIALFIGMFIDQNISKERMLILLNNKRLGEVYDFIKKCGPI